MDTEETQRVLSLRITIFICYIGILHTSTDRLSGVKQYKPLVASTTGPGSTI